MQSGEYDSPKHFVEKYPKIACIMVTHVNKEGFTGKGYRAFDIKPEYKRFRELIIESIRFTWACFDHYEAGVDYELIIVDNASPNKKFQKILETCPYKVIHRENKGYSYGGYKHAWEELGDKYDYYLFFEQDWVPSKDGWLAELLLKFHEDKKVGMVGNCMEHRSYPTGIPKEQWNAGQWTSGTHMARVCPGREWMCNLDGEYHFTSSRILKQVDEIAGGLMVFKCHPEHEGVSPSVNELAFQQPILELGYRLESFNDGKHIFTHGASRRNRNPKHKGLPITELAPMINGYVKDSINDRAIRKHFAWYPVKIGFYVKDKKTKKVIPNSGNAQVGK